MHQIKARLMRKIRKFIRSIGMGRWIFLRDRLAHTYLRGSGLEIGAMHNPLRVPDGVTVKYVDISTKEESIKKFPEINPSDVVDVSIISNGFRLEGVTVDSQDFVIANHVLEHSPHFIETLLHWNRVLHPGGILFITVPNKNSCFDKARAYTTYEHLKNDYTLLCEGRDHELMEENVHHYKEWLACSLPAITHQASKLSEEDLLKEAQSMCNRKDEIHFHTFSQNSFKTILEKTLEDYFPTMTLLEVRRQRLDIIAVLRK